MENDAEAGYRRLLIDLLDKTFALYTYFYEEAHLDKKALNLGEMLLWSS